MPLVVERSSDRRAPGRRARRRRWRADCRSRTSRRRCEGRPPARVDASPQKHRLHQRLAAGERHAAARPLDEDAVLLDLGQQLWRRSTSRPAIDARAGRARLDAVAAGAAQRRDACRSRSPVATMASCAQNGAHVPQTRQRSAFSSSSGFGDWLSGCGTTRSERAAFEEHGDPNARAVMNGEALDQEDEAGGATSTIRIRPAAALDSRRYSALRSTTLLIDHLSLRPYLSSSLTTSCSSGVDTSKTSSPRWRSCGARSSA